MQQVRRARRLYGDKLMTLDNVVGLGTGYKIIENQYTKIPAIMVLVKEKLPESKLVRSHRIPRSLGNVLTDVIEVGEVRLLTVRTEKFRPAMPGVSIGHYRVSAGTLGAVVKDAQTKEPLLLSNNHVFANATDGYDGKSKIGDAILQPGAHDGGTSDDVIAHLERFVPIQKNTSKSQCSIARRIENIVNFGLSIIKPDYRMSFIKKRKSYNLVDAAVAKPVKSEYVSEQILDLGKLNGTASAKIGMNLKKSGRTSHVTTGKVIALEVTLKVMLGLEEDATFYDQILTEPMAQPGDSGSIVVDENMRAIGLLFAGSSDATIINPIINVMKLLKITF